MGKGRQAAKTEIERLDLSSLTCRQGVTEVAKMCDPPFARSMVGSALAPCCFCQSWKQWLCCGCALPARCNFDHVVLFLEGASIMRPSLCYARCPKLVLEDSCVPRLVDLVAGRLMWAGAWRGAACTACMTRRSLSSSR